MTVPELTALLDELTALPQETEWVEFKHNKADPDEIGELISALSNSAALGRKPWGYLVWGVEDATHNIVGTTFKPRQAKVGNEELENWLARHLATRTNFQIYEFAYGDMQITLFKIQPAPRTPVAFRQIEYIRIGSSKKKLREYPEKARQLWAMFSETPFEKGIALSDVSAEKVVALIDSTAYFDLIDKPFPADRSGVLERLVSEAIVLQKGESTYDITNLGAVLFAKNLNAFVTLSRKVVRVVVYEGTNRVKTLKKQEGTKGYAAGFEGLVDYTNDQLPQHEEIGQALRTSVKMYPEIAIRELVANALIHQDFSISGTGPTIEIFSDRIEITNPGIPLIDPLRFLGTPPRSRNEVLASLMRRLKICEELGTGIVKVITEIEEYRLPAPEFRVSDNHFKATLFAPKRLSEMDKKDKIRACHQHACLMYVSNKVMTNASLRKRFAIRDEDYSVASRIIADTIEVDLVKRHDDGSLSRKHAKYVPAWA